MRLLYFLGSIAALLYTPTLLSIVFAHLSNQMQHCISVSFIQRPPILAQSNCSTQSDPFSLVVLITVIDNKVDILVLHCVDISADDEKRTVVQLLQCRLSRLGRRDDDRRTECRYPESERGFRHWNLHTAHVGRDIPRQPSARRLEFCGRQTKLPDTTQIVRYPEQNHDDRVPTATASFLLARRSTPCSRVSSRPICGMYSSNSRCSWAHAIL